MPAVINSGTSGDLNPGLGGSGGPVATAIGTVRKTFLSTSLGDALSAQISYGFDQFSGEARIVLPAPNGSIGDSVSVTMGAGNNVQRFSGTLVSFDTTLWPHSVTALCKGPLYLLEEYENGVETTELADGSRRAGLAFEDLVGASTATLQTIITSVLNTVGVSFGLGGFENPSQVYGAIPITTPFGTILADTTNFTWGSHETAAAYIHRILQASAGYRLFESSDGNIFFKQVSAIPAGSADWPAFTLGKDIFGNSQSVTSKIGQRRGVVVEGWDDSSGPARGTAGDISLPFRVFSNLIQTDAFAAELATFWLSQVNRLQEIVRLSTPRDELHGPLQTHHINLGSSLNDKLFVKTTMCEVTAGGEFTQHNTYIAGT